MKKSLIVFAGVMALGQAAQAGQFIQLRQGEARRIMLNDGRSVLFSCTRDGGRQTAAEIPLAAGRSIQITLYRDNSPSTVSCDQNAPRPQPPRPQPPRPQPPRPQPPRPQPPMPPTPNYGTDVVIFSNSDSCTGPVSGAATLYPDQDVADQCRSQLANPNASAWSIRTNGQCLNIEDTNALSACAQTSVPQRQDQLQLTIFSNSDSCSGSVSGSAILSTDRGLAEQCQQLASRGNGGASAWSVRLGNTCTNIQDTNVLSACMGVNLPSTRPTGTTDAVIYSNSDSCTGTVSGAVSLIPDYDLQDQCSNLTRMGTNSSAWSVKSNGACTNIQDTDVVSACLSVRVPSYRGARQVVIYSDSDSCSGSVSAAGYIDPRYSTIAQCQGLKQNGGSRSAWSIRIDDRCVNIQDTDFVSACIGTQF